MRSIYNKQLHLKSCSMNVMGMKFVTDKKGLRESIDKMIDKMIDLEYNPLPDGYDINKLRKPK